MRAIKVAGGSGDAHLQFAFLVDAAGIERITGRFVGASALSPVIGA